MWWKLFLLHLQSRQQQHHRPGIQGVVLQLPAIGTSDTGKSHEAAVSIYLQRDFAAWFGMLATSKPATKKTPKNQNSSRVSALLYGYSVEASHALIMELWFINKTEAMLR